MCIDLIFTNQPSLIIDSGIHHSFLHANCHHETTYAKLTLKIEYPPPYERLGWNYKRPHLQSIHKVIEGFNRRFYRFSSCP